MLNNNHVKMALHDAYADTKAHFYFGLFQFATTSCLKVYSFYQLLARLTRHDFQIGCYISGRLVE